jgi:hypothetical protein
MNEAGARAEGIHPALKAAGSGAVEVALTDAPGGTINGGAKAQLTSPFAGGSVLFLWKKQ